MTPLAVLLVGVTSLWQDLKEQNLRSLGLAILASRELRNFQNAFVDVGYHKPFNGHLGKTKFVALYIMIITVLFGCRSVNSK